MKGFRKGKVSSSVVQNLYGQSFLVEKINQKVSAALDEYLKTEKLNTLGRPIVSRDQPRYNFNYSLPEDLTFKFDIGFTPEFDLKSADKSATYTEYVVELSEAQVQEELDKIIKSESNQEQVGPEAGIQEGDVMKLYAKEVNGETDGTFSVAVADMTDELKAEFLTKKQGDTVHFDITKLENDTDLDFIKQNMLGVEVNKEISNDFEATIETVTRMMPAELGPDLYDKFFGKESKVHTEQDFKDAIKTAISRNYFGHTNGLLMKDIQNKLMTDNHLPLPDDFLKRWLVVSGEGKNTVDVVEKGYPTFADDLRWTLIKSKIAREDDIHVTKNELKAFYKAKLIAMIGGQFPVGDDFVNDLFAKVESDDKQYNELLEEALTQKTFVALKYRVSLEPKAITAEELESKFATARYNSAIENGDIVEEEVQHTQHALESAETTVEEAITAD